jgi:hypothetical protein
MTHTEIRFEGVDGIHLAQERVQWRALVDTVMKRLVSTKPVDF